MCAKQANNMANQATRSAKIWSGLVNGIGKINYRIFLIALCIVCVAVILRNYRNYKIPQNTRLDTILDGVVGKIRGGQPTCVGWISYTPYSGAQTHG